jgi:tRNA threonylcarbamoyladenosine biosynthesis protein TsaE
MNRFRFVGRNVDDTERLGQILADTLPDRTTVALHGTLGAGKTRLVQAVAVACEVPRYSVVSPTFVLCQEYYGRRTIYHFDAYRLAGDDEFQQLGPQEYFSSAGIVFIEWAERVNDSLPVERIEIRIEVTGDDERTFEISGVGERFESVLRAIEQRLLHTP